MTKATVTGNKMNFSWDLVDTILLDMDGTLLDLHYDNYFWGEYLPFYYSKQHKLSLIESKKILEQYSNDVRGTLDWYCLDYWSELLSTDIVKIKSEIDDKIDLRPHAIEFLAHLNKINKRVILATNAHPKTLELKLVKKDFSEYFDAMSSSHDLGYPKEEQEYWHALTKKFDLDPKRCLFVDDSLPILASAERFGIGHLLAIPQPDSQKKPRDCSPYTGISDFCQLI